MAYNERHYDAKEVAELWGFSQSFIRSLFQNEPDVIIVGSDEDIRRCKRQYKSLRIPESAVRRVYARISRRNVA